MNKRDLNQLLKAINKRKRAIFEEALGKAASNLHDLATVKTLMDQAYDDDQTLNKLGATASKALEAYFKQKLSGLRAKS